MTTFHCLLRAGVCCTTVIVLAGLFGCERDYYEVEMKPDGEKLHREVTVWREKTEDGEKKLLGFPEEDLRRIAAAYEREAPPSDPKKHTFAGEFLGKTPNDLGGDGSLTFWESPLGSTSAYVERIRGNDDFLLNVEQRLKASDRLIDLLRDWLATELDDEPRFDRLRKFVDTEFRRDMKNLSLYVWSYEIVGHYDVEARKELFIRIGQYLVERDYFVPDDLPSLCRAIQDWDRCGPSRLLAIVQRLVATQMGVAPKEAIPTALHYLGDANLVQVSFTKFIHGTDEYKQLLSKWKTDKQKNPDASQPSSSSVFEQLISDALSFQLFDNGDSLSMKLELPHAPFAANGKWNERTKQITWSELIQPSDSNHLRLPTLLFAFWSQPNVMMQETHFGKVVLDGETMAQYCLWYRGLSQEEAVEWNKFVMTLLPGDDLVQRIEGFRFSHEPADDENGENMLSTTARELIVSELKDDPDSGKEP
jgi:hypothetical protein